MEKKCPLLKRACLEHHCMWYMRVPLKDPEEGWGCAITHAVLTNLEVAMQVAQLASSTDSMRNETVKRQNALAGMIQLAVKEEGGEEVYELDAGEVAKVISGDDDENAHGVSELAGPIGE